MVNNGNVTGVPVTARDVRRAVEIYGKNVFNIPNNMVRVGSITLKGSVIMLVFLSMVNVPVILVSILLKRITRMGLRKL